MVRPISLLYGNVNPNTGLPINALIGDQNFPSPVGVSALPQITNNPAFNENVTMRSGDPIVPRPMNQVGMIAGDTKKPSLLTPQETIGSTPPTGLLGTGFNDPRTMGALNASAELLKLGGYSVGKPAPTTGQGLGLAGQAFIKGYQDQQDRLASQQQTGLKNQLAMAQYMNDLQKMQIDLAKTAKDDAKTKFTQEKDLRKEFTTLAKPFRETITNFNKAYAFASKKNPTGASDIALVFSFMKALDPRSVVRENEQASTENAGGVPAYVRNAWNKISTGQKFDPKVRAEILEASRSLVLGQLQTQKDLESEYAGYSQRNKLDQRNVFTSLLPKAGTYLNPVPVTTMQEAEEKLKDGQFFIINGQIGVIE